jgi:hypothetical protein
MSEVETSAVESGLEKVADTHRDLLAERQGNTLWFFPSKNTSDQSRSFFTLLPRDGRYWVRCQGKGGTRPDYPGPAISDITEEWVVNEATQFIETTVRDFGLKSDTAGS